MVSRIVITTDSPLTPSCFGYTRKPTPLPSFHLDMVNRDRNNHRVSLNPFVFQVHQKAEPPLPPSTLPPPRYQQSVDLALGHRLAHKEALHYSPKIIRHSFPQHSSSNNLLPSPHYIEFSLINITMNNREQGGTVRFGGLSFVVSGIAAGVGLASESIQHHKEKKAAKKAEAGQREQSRTVAARL